MAQPLYPYQERGAAWLARTPHAFLADQMRVGKTPQAIRACDLVGATTILVLCPAIARSNWAREFETFSDRGRTCGVWLTAQSTVSTELVICSYDLATTPAGRSRLTAVHWDEVILDEAHYCKNAHAKRTKMAYGLTTQYCWRLSGTPAPNHAGELYPHLHAAGLWPSSYRSFIEHFCQLRDTPYGVHIIGNRQIPQLKALIAPFFLRRLLVDVVKELPPIEFSQVDVDATEPDIRRWFPAVMIDVDTPERIHAQIAEELQAVEAVLALTGAAKMGAETLAALQSRKTSSSRRWVGLQKVPAIAEMIANELRGGAYKKIVLFAWHKDVITYLHDLLQAFHPVVIYGGTPPMKRDRHIRSFQKYGTCQVLIGNILAAGVAIDLSVAHEVAFVEASWVPGENAQAAMRVHHLHQTHPVRVRFFSLAGSIDARIQSILRRKTRDLTHVFDESRPATQPATPVVPNPFD